MVEVAQVRELVAERVDHDGVLQHVGRAQLMESDANPPVRVADAVAAPHALALGVDRAQRQLERAREQGGVPAQPFDRAIARLALGLGQRVAPGGAAEV